MNTNTTINGLHEHGILSPTSKVNLVRINSISGAVSGPLAKTLWEMSDCDPAVLRGLHSLLADLHRQDCECEMMKLLRLLYGLLCMTVPDPVLAISKHPEAQSCFLMEFLLDLDDIIDELDAEQ